jgi:hypothetical protein
MTGRAREVPKVLISMEIMGGSQLEVGRTEKVHVLVDSIASNGGEAELLDELAADVDNLALESTDLQGLLTGSLKVLLLANIGH